MYIICVLQRALDVEKNIPADPRRLQARSFPEELLLNIKSKKIKAPRFT